MAGLQVEGAEGASGHPSPGLEAQENVMRAVTSRWQPIDVAIRFLLPAASEWAADRMATHWTQPGTAAPFAERTTGSGGRNDRAAWS